MPPISSRLLSVLAAAAAATALAIGVRWGTFAAGGSDWYCYVNEAALFASGRTALDLPLAVGAPWPSAASSFVPVGHRLRQDYEQGRSERVTGDREEHEPVTVPQAVPICPPGLPLLMAFAEVIAGRQAVFFVVPILGAAAVWLTFVLGTRLAGSGAGAASAILLACSPIFLYQVVQPMTDVPAATWWLAAMVLATRGTQRGAVEAGAAAGMALLTRPNLFLVAPLLAGFVALGGDAVGGVSRWVSKTRVYRLAAFAVGALPFLVLLAWLQDRMYGAATAVGYGRPGELYAVSNVLPNLRLYPVWLLETHTPFLLIGVGAVLLPRLRTSDTVQRRLAWLCLLVSVAVLVSYLPYHQFQDWWYIRFLLPAVPLLIVLSVAVLSSLMNLLPARVRVAALATIVLLTGASWVRVAHARAVFKLSAYEARFVESGRFIARALPPDTVVLTVSESGSVEYYSGRPTLIWAALPPDGLDRALTFLSGRGRTPFILVEADEEPAFRSRFAGGSAVGNLDWPPVAEIRTVVRVRIYDPADRARYQSGIPVVTKYEWPAEGDR